jgi:hypothetical protein
VEVPAKVAVSDAGVIGPRGERAGGFTEDKPGEAEDGGDEGAGPTSAEVCEFGEGLGEEELVGVALKVAQDGGSEDGGYDDHA